MGTQYSAGKQFSYSLCSHCSEHSFGVVHHILGISVRLLGRSLNPGTVPSGPGSPQCCP
jgi:hypothetical protein